MSVYRTHKVVIKQGIGNKERSENRPCPSTVRRRRGARGGRCVTEEVEERDSIRVVSCSSGRREEGGCPSPDSSVYERQTRQQQRRSEKSAVFAEVASSIPEKETEEAEEEARCQVKLEL